MATATASPVTHPLQWATDYEVRDLRAALDYLRTRVPITTRRASASSGSAGAGRTALVVGVGGARRLGRGHRRRLSDPRDDAWPTCFAGPRSSFAAGSCWTLSDAGCISFLAGRACSPSQRRLNCRFPDIETAAARLSPRPWLMIHGETRRLHRPGDRPGRSSTDAGEPKELWLVPEAKHNRCRECRAGRPTRPG